MAQRKVGLYEKYIKRIIDLVLSTLALVVLSPVILVVAILVRVNLGSPIIFKQPRPGKNGKVFWMYKFRSMTDQKDENGKLLPDEVRLTTFGKKLRSTSLDELPELWNVVKGDISIVGPRPQLVRDMVFMSKEQRRRHSVRQGLTGLAQVNGRNNISWEEKIEWDLKYIDDGISFWGDIKIVFKTIGKVFARADVATEGMETAEDYGDYLLRAGKIDRNVYVELQKEAKSILAKMSR